MFEFRLRRESFLEKINISLSTLVLNSRDQHEKYGFLKNTSTEKPDNNIFLQYAAMQSIGTMPLAP